VAISTPLPADLTRFLETIWQIKTEKAEAARERLVTEEMARYREQERHREYRPADVHSAGAPGLVTIYAEVQ
jgi:hypothetical protein